MSVTLYGKIIFHTDYKFLVLGFLVFEVGI